MTMTYISSEKITFQGSREAALAACRKYGKEYILLERGNGGGNWTIYRPSDVLVNGVSYRDFVLEHYKRSKLTEKLADLFFEELKAGKVTLPQSILA